jgi:hypothetical protein
MFKNKYKKIVEEIQENVGIINDNQLEIIYYDNSNVSLVQSGKIQEQKGWIIIKHKEHYSQVQTDKIIYKDYLDALLGIKQWQV